MFLAYADYPVDAGEVVDGFVTLKLAEELSPCLLEWMEVER